MVQEVRTTLAIDFTKWPCVRLANGDVKDDEKHPCYMCANPIPVTSTKCTTCDFMICPKCSTCFCTLSNEDKLAMILIHFNYCMNKSRLVNFDDFKDDIPMGSYALKTSARKALLYCSSCFKGDE